MVACSITQMLYSKQLRNYGWERNNLLRLDGLVWKHAVMAEEYYGLDFCSENLEYSTHIVSEIERHSSPDNYSCELYERAIRSHKLQKHNAKGIEKTYAERESIRHFINAYQLEHGSLSTYGEGKHYKFNIQATLDNHVSFYFHEKSIEAATTLLEECDGHESPLVQHAISHGVAVGKIKRQHIYGHQLNDIKRYFCREFPNAEIAVPDIVKLPSSVIMFDEFGQVIKVCKGSICVVSGGQDAREEWVIEISKIVIVGPIEQCYFTFIDGRYFIPAFSNGIAVKHDWTDTHKLLPHSYTRDSVQPLPNIKRKVILYPEPSNAEDPQYFLKIDIHKPEVELPVQVPVSPEVDDSVKIRGTNNEIWYGKVQEVHDHQQTITVAWYNESRRADVWRLTAQEDTVSCFSILDLVEVRRVFGGFRFEQ